MFSGWRQTFSLLKIIEIRPMTRKDLFLSIDSLQRKKATGSMNIPSWSIQCAKLAPSKHLQILITECTKSKAFPDELKKRTFDQFIKKMIE